MINVKFVEKSLEDQIATIKMFLSERNDFSMLIANFFNIADCFDKTEAEKSAMIEAKVGKFYREHKALITAKTKICQTLWGKHRDFINDQFAKIFGEELNFDCTASVNINPVCPRYIENKAFDINALDSNEGILETSLHEIIHFAWFKTWAEQFPNTTHKDMNAPSLGWRISEIAVDPIFKNSELKRFLVRNPAYDYFYQEKIDNQNMMEVVNDLYTQSSSIKDFQNKMLGLFNKNIEQNQTQEPVREL